MNTYEVSQVKPGPYIAQFKNGQVAYATVGYSKLDDPKSPRWIAAPHFVASTADQSYWNSIESLKPHKEPNHRTLFIDLEYERMSTEPQLRGNATEKDTGDIALEDFRDLDAYRRADRVIVADGPKMRILKNRGARTGAGQKGWLVSVGDVPSIVG